MWPSRETWKTWSPFERLSAASAWAGIAALVVTVFVLLVDNLRLRRESLLVSVGAFRDDVPVDLREGYGNHLPYQLTFVFPVTLINHGLRPVAVTEYELFPINCEYQYTFRGQDGDQGLFESPTSDTPVILPFAVAPGEGKTLFLKTAIVVSDRTTDGALDLPPGKTVRDLMLRIFTTDAGDTPGESEDFFGNALGYGIGARGIVSFEHETPEALNQPVYRLVVHTARRRTYATIFAPYPQPRITKGDCSDEPFEKLPTLQLQESQGS